MTDPATFERVSSFRTLLEAAGRARRANPRNHDTLSFFAELEQNLLELRDDLRDDTYQPGPLRRFVIYEPKERIISAAPFRDRVVHHAVCAVVEPLFERALTPHTFACRRGLGLHRAVLWTQRCLRRRTYALKCDVRHYFETVDHELLRRAVAKRIDDRRIRDLLATIIENGAVGSTHGRPFGLPIGNLTSQHLANYFLMPLDRWILHRIDGNTFCRYMDDLLIMSNGKAMLWDLHERLDAVLKHRFRLTLKREVSAVYKYTVGVPFLGMRIFRGTIRLGGPARRRLIRKLRSAERALLTSRIDEETYRAKVNGLLGYATGASTLALRQSIL